MEENQLSDSKLYELALNTKNHAEDRRDEINKYYPSLFGAIIAIMPFIDRFNQNVDKVIGHGFSIQIALMLLSTIGMIISLSWVLTLKRTFNYLEAIDKLLIDIEVRNGKSFILYTNKYLEKINSPERVTKQAMIVPYTFIIIFLISLLRLLAQQYI
jgi:hypothetical protein